MGSNGVDQRVEALRMQLQQVAAGQVPPERVVERISKDRDDTARRQIRSKVGGYSGVGIVAALLGYGSHYLADRDEQVERRVHQQYETKAQRQRVEDLETFRQQALTTQDGNDLAHRKISRQIANVRRAIDAAHPMVSAKVPAVPMIDQSDTDE